MRHGVLVCILLVAGCAPITPDYSLQQKSQSFQPTVGMAGVYVFRPNQFLACGTHLRVEINRSQAGVLPPKAYIYKEITPGTQEVALAVGPSAKIRPRGTFVAQAGRCYFFRAAATWGRPSFKQVTEEKGRERVRNLALNAD